MKDDLQEGVSLLALCARESETDIGNGGRFRHRHGRDVLAVARIGWHCFDGLRWREDEDGSLVRPLAHKTAEAIRFECEEIEPSEGEAFLMQAGDDAEAYLSGMQPLTKESSLEERQRVAKLKHAIQQRDEIAAGIRGRRSARASYCKASQNSAKLDNMLKEAAPYLSRTVDRMNTDVHALNARNGTLRFVVGGDIEGAEPGEPRVRWHARLDPHEREDFITKLCEASVLSPAPSQGKTPPKEEAKPSGRLFDSDAMEAVAHQAAPKFIEFLHVVQPDVEMRAYLRRLAGYMLTGLTGEQIIAFFYGIGANGKSTFTEVIGKILSDYAVTLGIESFTGEARRGGADATPDLARLNGAYACFASEGDESARLKEGLIKLLTGDDKIAVRKLHQDFVEISIKAKFVITGNHKPIIRGDDDGIWRRVHLVEWPVQIPREDRDKDLAAKLLGERDGILAWMISGAIEFLTRGGLHPPAKVLAAVDEHREESDPIGAFIRGACEVTGDEADTCSPGDLYAAYLIYCRREGMTPLSATTFNRRLPDKTRQAWKAPDGRHYQFMRTKSSGTLYRGLVVLPAFRPGVERPGEPFPEDRAAPPPAAPF